MTTTDQSHQIMAALATNVNWAKVRFEGANLQELLIRDPSRAAEQFTAFLNNGAKLIIGEPKIITIERSKPFDPSAFKGLGKGWTTWKGPSEGDGLTGEEEQDARSLKLTELDLTKVQFESCLRKGESSIKGEEKYKRLTHEHAEKIRLDAQVFLTLWENQHLIPASGKELTNGNTTYVFFDGTILRSPGGGRFVLCLYWSDGEWQWGCDWLGSDWDARSLSALLASES